MCMHRRQLDIFFGAAVRKESDVGYEDENTSNIPWATIYFSRSVTIYTQVPLRTGETANGGGT